MVAETPQADDNGVVASIDFCPAGDKVIFYPGDREKSQWPYRPHDVVIRDMRPIAEDLALDRNGFVLVNRQSPLTTYDDPDEVQRVYVPAVMDLVAEVAEADKVIAFGTMIRTDAKNTAQHNLPAYGAHVDYGDYTVRQFATEVLGEEEASEWLAGRYMLINVWRPITVVHRAPFAVCDASTVAKTDLCDSEVRGGLGDASRPTLYGHAISFNENQRWYYAPQMRPEEVLLFRLFDSDPSAVQWTAHSAFAHPETAPDAPPRQSIELRTIAFRK